MVTSMPYDISLVAAKEGAAIQAGVLDYLKLRQSMNGGFCTYRSPLIDEPSIGDTYYAIRAYDLLGETVPLADRCTQYIYQSRGFGAINYLYFSFFVLKCLGVELNQDIRDCLKDVLLKEIKEFVPDKGPIGLFHLSSLRKIVRLLGCLKVPVPEYVYAHLWTHYNGDGSVGDPGNTEDSFMFYDVFGEKLCGYSKFEARNFLHALQDERLGFCFTRNSVTASLDNIFYGLRCCKYLEVAPKYPTACLKIINSCQRRDGGFSRAPGALADIEHCYRAIWCISFLKMYS